jgi:hypothetical protein
VLRTLVKAAKVRRRHPGVQAGRGARLPWPPLAAGAAVDFFGNPARLRSRSVTFLGFLGEYPSMFSMASNAVVSRAISARISAAAFSNIFVDLLMDLEDLRSAPS